MAAGKICIGGSKEETLEWTGLFPTDLKSEQDSLVFVKRLMAVAVSSITYLTGIFPEYAYRSRYLEDLCIKILHGNCNSPGANKVVKWMMGCFDALEKQYLQIIFIGVYTNPEDPNRIIESYQFSFRYTEKGPEMDILRNNDMELQVTPEETKRASVLLIRKLFLLMQNLDSLPNNVYLTMKLYYYDEITPWDYQPPGFKEGVCDHLWFEGMPVHFKVGEHPSSTTPPIDIAPSRLKLMRRGPDRKSEFLRALKDEGTGELTTSSSPGTSGEGESSTPEPKAYSEEVCHENGLSYSLSDSDTEHLSSSLEAEHRLLKAMGWQEYPENDDNFLPLTEDELREFQTKTEQLKKNGMQRNGVLPRTRGVTLHFTPWRSVAEAHVEEGSESETSSSSQTSDDDDCIKS
ncbi:HORMA domain-containing protein 1-like [Melanotaenia boesemani]|uniref:HORMA domain-containing protein 1-like n=1 Tax=Melanotaenia boesemani TaxID=1250792 RepID=UPI001C03D604|nr:HORMA domain-containing protein 1-like [Melanotaenia boesemani]